MTSLPITSALAGAAALMLVALSLPIALRRRKNRVSAGDGGDAFLGKMVRAQGNYTEYTPMVLILIGLLEMGGAQPATTLWALGGVFAVGRVLHVMGMLGVGLIFRALGMILTFGVLLAAAGMLLRPLLPI